VCNGGAWSGRQDENMESAKELFTEALFTAASALVRNEISDSAKSLIRTYFNDSLEPTIAGKAFAALKRYTGDDLPEEEKQSQGLKRSLNDLQYYADMWEEE